MENSESVKRKYRIAPIPAFLDKRRSSSLLFEGRLRDSPNFDKDETFALMKSQIDLELAQMRNMSKKEAAAAAARAVADAEAAIAEAEEAAREAEQAEADAEAAQAFAELAMKTWKARNAQKMMMRP